MGRRSRRYARSVEHGLELILCQPPRLPLLRHLGAQRLDPLLVTQLVGGRVRVRVRAWAWATNLLLVAQLVRVRVRVWARARAWVTNPPLVHLVYDIVGRWQGRW